MQLESKEILELLKIIRILVQEAQWDFSAYSNFAVLRINGQSMFLDKPTINLLSKICDNLEANLKMQNSLKKLC